MENKITKWSLFKKLIEARCLKPTSHPEYIIYFFLINIVFGAIGIYVNLFVESTKDGPFDYRSLNNNIATYYIAILAGGCFDLILSKAKIMKNTMSLFAITVLILGIAAVILSYALRLRYGLPLTILFTMISLFIWWIANAENDKLMNDVVPPDVTTGGDINKMIMGDLGDFKH